MSKNVELVRQIFDSINQADLDGALEATADDFEMDWASSIGPAKGVYRGREQVRDLWASYFDAFESFEWNPEEFIEVDDFRVIVVNRARIRGRGSGIEVNARGAQLWTIRDGQAHGLKLYQSRGEALAAAGLSE